MYNESPTGCSSEGKYYIYYFSVHFFLSKVPIETWEGINFNVMLKFIFFTGYIFFLVCSQVFMQ